jgi:hypothetical protein
MYTTTACTIPTGCRLGEFEVYFHKAQNPKPLRPVRMAENNLTDGSMRSSIPEPADADMGHTQYAWHYASVLCGGRSWRPLRWTAEVLVHEPATMDPAT